MQIEKVAHVCTTAVVILCVEQQVVMDGLRQGGKDWLSAS